MVRIAQKLFRTTDRYDGDKLVTVENGRRVLTPMVLVMAAIGGTDVLFALDSIPAIYGLTENVYIVFTATVFSLLGLRQLFFLIDGLLDRLIYLSYGLATILAFIGIKLILHALHENNVPFINGGEPVNVVEISTGLSLSVIIGVLLITVVASLVSQKGNAQNAVTNARRHAKQYLDLSYEADQQLREKTFEAMLREEQIIRGLPEKYRRRIRDEHELIELLQRAHTIKDQRVAAGYGSAAAKADGSG
jgi:tellurite resistance protein TerC